jgi:hypothetical protein
MYAGICLGGETVVYGGQRSTTYGVLIMREWTTVLGCIAKRKKTRFMVDKKTKQQNKKHQDKNKRRNRHHNTQHNEKTALYNTTQHNTTLRHDIYFFIPLHVLTP